MFNFLTHISKTNLLIKLFKLTPINSLGIDVENFSTMRFVDNNIISGRIFLFFFLEGSPKQQSSNGGDVEHVAGRWEVPGTL